MRRAFVTKTPILLRAAALSIALCIGAVVTSPASAQVSPEYLIKAEYLYRFAMFVEWPADAFTTPTVPITIAIVGPDPFGSALDLTIRDKRINNRALVVRRLQWGQDPRPSQIVFLSATESGRIGELAQRLEGAPVLIVGDTADLARRGATVNFRIDDNRVRFDINQEAATRARLQIRWNLLDVARIVRSASPAASR